MRSNLLPRNHVHAPAARPPEVSSATLSPARRELLAIFQRVGYGRIEYLIVRAGEPVVDPAPRVVPEFRFTDDEDRPVVRPAVFTLKVRHLNFFRALDRVRDGVLVVRFRDGLPFTADQVA